MSRDQELSLPNFRAYSPNLSLRYLTTVTPIENQKITI